MRKRSRASALTDAFLSTSGFLASAERSMRGGSISVMREEHPLVGVGPVHRPRRGQEPLLREEVGEVHADGARLEDELAAVLQDRDVAERVARQVLRRCGCRPWPGSSRTRS